MNLNKNIVAKQTKDLRPRQVGGGGVIFLIRHVISKACFRALTKAFIGEGGGYSYIRVLPYEFLLKSVVITVDFKRNSSCRTRIYEYAPPPPPPHTHTINALVTALKACALFK